MDNESYLCHYVNFSPDDDIIVVSINKHYAECCIALYEMFGLEIKVFFYLRSTIIFNALIFIYKHTYSFLQLFLSIRFVLSKFFNNLFEQYLDPVLTPKKFENFTFRKQVYIEVRNLNLIKSMFLFIILANDLPHRQVKLNLMRSNVKNVMS